MVGALWLLVMLLLAYFSLNLFVATLVDEFERSRQALGESYLLTPAQKEWLKTQELLILLRPGRRRRPPTGTCRGPLFRLVTSEGFEAASLIAIAMNAVALAIPFFGMPATYAHALETLNVAFCFIFSIEAVLKIIAFGPRDLFCGAGGLWNSFDVLIVVFSDVGALLAAFSSVQLGAAAAVLRLARVLRVLRVARSLKGLQAMLSALLLALPSLANIALLLGLLICVYAAAGVALFGQVARSGALDAHANFESFGTAALTLWRVLTGEGWPLLMAALSNDVHCDASPQWDAPYPQGCGNGVVAGVYFVSYILVGSWCMVQLLVAVVLEAFADVADADAGGGSSGGGGGGGGAQVTREQLDRFAAAWLRQDPDGTTFVPAKRLHLVLAALPPPMGTAGEDDGNGNEAAAAMAAAASLRVPTYPGNFVHMADVALACARRAIAAAVAARGEAPLAELPNTHALSKRWERLRGPASRLQTDLSLQHFVAADTILAAFRAFRLRRALAV